MRVIVGDTARCRAEVKNSLGALVDPSALVFKIKVPGVPTPVVYTYGVSPEVTRLSLGIFYLDYVPTVEGTHFVRCETTNPKSAREDSITAITALA